MRLNQHQDENGEPSATLDLKIMSITAIGTTPFCHMCCLPEGLPPGERQEEAQVHPGEDEAC